MFDELKSSSLLDKAKYLWVIWQPKSALDSNKCIFAKKKGKSKKRRSTYDPKNNGMESFYIAMIIGTAPIFRQKFFQDSKEHILLCLEIAV